MKRNAFSSSHPGLTLRTSLLGAAIAAALGLPQLTLAQDREDTEADALLEEVVVTAQRREQSLQEVPMAISAFTEQQLRDLQADNLDSIQGAVPNLNLVQGRGSNSSVNVFIRGVGQPDALQTFDPAVGIYLDDVYMSRIQGAMFKLYDIERIEVLRGPQGTLYGKNTPGGAIRLVTRNPGDDFEAAANLTLGDYNRVQASGYLSGPVSENLSLGLSVLHDQRDGFVTDPLTGREYNDEYTTVARLKGVWQASDNLEAVFSFDYTQEDVELTLGRAEAPLVSIDLGTGGAVPRFIPGNEEWNFDSSTSLTDAGGQQVDHWGGNLTLNWTINSGLELRSITAYRDLETSAFIDIDATTLELGDVFVGLDQNQFSQELQLLGDNGGDIKWVAGLYYLDESVPSDQAAFADDFLLFNGFPISFLRTINDDLNTESYAAFGQVDWAFADRWNLGLGIRYTYEKKSYFRTTSTFSDILGVADPAFEFSDSDSWDDWTPTVTLDYALNDNVNFYGRVAKGFKSGGFNGRANSAADVSTFDPETVWSAELGAKTILADGRVQANFAVFTSQYDDFQARVSVGDGIDFRFPVLNAAELDINGAELELAWFPIDALQLTSQIGYLDAEYGAGGFTGSDGVEDEPAFSPEWTARFGGIYTLDLSGGSYLRFGADANYRDAMFLSVENVAALTEGDYWLLNGFVSWTSADEHWTVTAGMKNATDEVYRVEGQEFRSVGNIQTAYYGDPRTWTVALDYRF
ncbi:MAG: TonB-dependent receptor [Xanthomonadales bacterium]|nr:TonB-dependent receptor [Xanthomonadales bacterium]